MSVQEEFEPNFNARWAFEEHMHILEEEEADRYEGTNFDEDFTVYDEDLWTWADNDRS